MSQAEVLPVTVSFRRHRWTDAEKLRILEQSCAAPRVAAAAALRRPNSRPFLTRWRREAREGLLPAAGGAAASRPWRWPRIASSRGLRSVAAGGDVSARRAEIILPNGRRPLIGAMLEGTALARLIQTLDRE